MLNVCGASGTGACMDEAEFWVMLPHSRGILIEEIGEIPLLTTQQWP